MSKRVHPIRKMCDALEKVYWAGEDPKHLQTVARHIKPLLDALELLHPGLQTLSKTGHRYYKVPHSACHFCRLLAAWRAKL